MKTRIAPKNTEESLSLGGKIVEGVVRGCLMFRVKAKQFHGHWWNNRGLAREEFLNTRHAQGSPDMYKDHERVCWW